jgi:hypothetical protein
MDTPLRPFLDIFTLPSRLFGRQALNPRLIFSSSVIPAKAGIQFISIAVLGDKRGRGWRWPEATEGEGGIFLRQWQSFFIAWRFCPGCWSLLYWRLRKILSFYSQVIFYRIFLGNTIPLTRSLNKNRPYVFFCVLSCPLFLLQNNNTYQKAKQKNLQKCYKRFKQSTAKPWYIISSILLLESHP